MRHYPKSVKVDIRDLFRGATPAILLGWVVKDELGLHGLCWIWSKKRPPIATEWCIIEYEEDLVIVNRLPIVKSVAGTVNGETSRRAKSPGRASLREQCIAIGEDALLSSSSSSSYNSAQSGKGGGLSPSLWRTVMKNVTLFSPLKQSRRRQRRKLVRLNI